MRLPKIKKGQKTRELENLAYVLTRRLVALQCEYKGLVQAIKRAEELAKEAETKLDQILHIFNVRNHQRKVKAIKATIDEIQAYIDGLY